MPPYLAGRERERAEFEKLLCQRTVLANLVVTGLRGIGKTVLVESFRSVALEAGWLWVGVEASEAASRTETSLADRLLVDLATVTSPVKLGERDVESVGFRPRRTRVADHLGYGVLRSAFEASPGLPSDKLKATLECAWLALERTGKRGVVFALDEAQNLSDHAEEGEYPLALLLDVFQSLQRRGVPFLLVLAGLPTLFPRLVESRTYAERMFHVETLGRLDAAQTRDAILKPLGRARRPFGDATVEAVFRHSGGYPYFVQFLCAELYDGYLQWARHGDAEALPALSFDALLRKLDADFYPGRWNRTTDRQRELLAVIAGLPSCDEEFTVQEIVQASRAGRGKPFSPSHVSQMLSALADAGIVYRSRHGRHAFALPLFGRFVRRALGDALGGAVLATAPARGPRRRAAPRRRRGR